MEKILLNEIYGNFVSTLIALAVILLAYLILDLTFAKKIEAPRQKQNFRIRSFYVACFVFIFLMARIWVEGFTQLLAVLGLVSAALVITNKETIMNVVGWIIINWRDLFAEDDLIQIEGYKGYVKSFGLLYFSLSEFSERSDGCTTGRIIRIPNGLLATHALINFSQTSHLYEQTFSIIITKDSDELHAVNFLTELVSQTISVFYKEKKEFSAEYLLKHHRRLAAHIRLKPKVYITPKFENPSGTTLTTHYFCFFQDSKELQQQIWTILLSKIKNEDAINLSYES